MTANMEYVASWAWEKLDSMFHYFCVLRCAKRGSCSFVFAHTLVMEPIMQCNRGLRSMYFQLT
jgi:hypothetical protein